jgi:hypothetical protein
MISAALCRRAGGVHGAASCVRPRVALLRLRLRAAGPECIRPRSTGAADAATELRHDPGGVRPGANAGRGLSGEASASLRHEGEDPGLRDAQAIAAGAAHSLALRNDGTVVAWGLDSDGQTSIPAGLSGVTAIAAGAMHSLALRSDGTVVAWGSNEYGEAAVPAGLSDVIAISARWAHSLAPSSCSIRRR